MLLPLLKMVEMIQEVELPPGLPNWRGLSMAAEGQALTQLRLVS